jgi:hypothetical protein
MSTVQFNIQTNCEHIWQWVNNEVIWKQKHNKDGTLKIDLFGRIDLEPLYHRVDKCSKCKKIEKTCLN